MRSNNTRMTRINEEIRREISEIIRQELKDPRIHPMVSIVSVETTNDLKYTKIFVSVMGSEEEKEDTLKGLNSATGFIRRELAKRINLRNTPEILFKLDESIEYGIHMSKLIERINKDSGDE